jgi:hypothetical protein
MKKSFVVGLAVLTVSASAALAAHRTHHSHATKPAAATNANPNTNVFGVGGGTSPVIWPGGVSAADHDLYIKNQHDSGVKQ